MSSSTTFKVTVWGDSFDELQDRAETEIADLLQVPIEEVQQKVNYELIITKAPDMESEFVYSCDMIAKLRHDYR